MLASVHLVDGRVRSTIGALRRPPTPDDAPGLREARTVIAAPLGRKVPTPQPSRLGLVAFWEDEPALDAFLADHPLAETLADGWSVRLDPLRAVAVAGGHFPGVPDDLPTAPAPDGDKPVAVLTIGRLRLARAVPFFRASARAEKQVLTAPGLLWGTGLANLGQRVVSTFSLWEAPGQTRAYATTDAHADAAHRDRRRSFHHAGSFIRFRPYAATGELPGRNPLPEAVTAGLGDTAVA